MKYQEIEKLLQYNDYKGMESKLFMPNEIFEDLRKHLNEVKIIEEKPVEYITVNNKPRKKRGNNKGASVNHIAYAYAYTYLSTWIYRYAKHLVSKKPISNITIKEILAYSAGTRTINYLTNKDGLLDTIGYFKTEKDFPVWYNFSEHEGLEFVMYAEQKEMFIDRVVPRNYTVKCPVKAFERKLDEEGNIELEGTFFDVENTHNIPFEVFMYCMSNDNLGCNGFFLYAYLKHKNDIFNGYDVSLEKLSEQTGIPPRTLDQYLGRLKSYRMIDFTINQSIFALGLREQDRMANTYKTNDYEDFSDKPIPYNRIEVMKKKDYLEMIKAEDEKKKIVWGESDEDLDKLPF